jgi:hypothetical protein
MLKRNVLIIVLALCSINLFGQSEERIFDKGKGMRESLRTGHLAIQHIQKNDLTSLLLLYKENPDINVDQLKDQVNEVSSAFPFDDSSVPESYMDNSDSEFYYERNFYKEINNDIQCVLQIHVTLIIEKKTFKVSQIDFRRGKAIVKRVKEIQDIKKRNVNPGLKPPPPAPPTGW